ncbi:MAG: FAD-dependent oxidoreductase [Anaeromyxobacteraceae bacterium]
MSDSSFSRRNFLSRAAVAAAGAGVLTACGSDSDDKAADFWLPARWDAEADVVIVGFGAAGASAAYHAAKAGASVRVLDTSEAGGGDTAASGGFVFFGGGTALQAQAGVAETADQMLATVRAMGGDQADPELQKVWCQRNKEAYDFLDQACGTSWGPADMMFTGNEAHGMYASVAPNGVPVKHGLLDPEGGAGLFSKISTAVLATPGVTFTGLMKAVRLVQDPRTRRVLGVVAKPVTDTGAFVEGAAEQFFKARKGVVVATGAFSRDTAMMARHSTDLARLTHLANKYADGSGIRMGQAVGGDVRNMKTFWAYCLKAGTPAFSKSVLIDEAGSRFAPEDASPYTIGYHQVRQHPVAFAIADASVYAVKPSGGYEGATIEALVAAINAGEGTSLSAPVVKATIDGYNAMVAGGSDPVFKKAAAYLVPISTGPFYAVKVSASDAIGTTTGGLRIDTASRLLDPAGAAIPSLYAAGTCTSAAPSERYTGSGTAISSCLTFGKIAAEGVVAETAW